jgi:hypothetical protein
MLAAPPGVKLGATIVAAGEFSAPYARLTEMRRMPPTFAGADIAAHFLKHADEHTIAVIEAVRLALQHGQLDASQTRDWAMLSGPRYIGRLAAKQLVTRFDRQGGSSITTHAASQYSLNSPAAAVSIVLGSHGPNVGVGGGPWGLADGCLTALSLFDVQAVPGAWLLFSQWDPEPIADERGQPTHDCTCHAVALALRPGSATDGPSLSATFDAPGAPRPLIRSGQSPFDLLGREPMVWDLATCVRNWNSGLPTSWSCPLPGAGQLDLNLPIEAGSARLVA